MHGGAFILNSGMNINLQMVKKGMAEVYRGRHPKGLDLNIYRQAKKVARQTIKGMWRLGDTDQSPKDWRKRPSG
jgi:micrococcal nuclease